MDKQTFITTIANEAKAICLEKGYGYASYATCVSQSCCETGYGRSTIMVNNFAPFGIKATKSWLQADPSRKCFSSKTGEVYDGKAVTITACFRAYDSWNAGVRDYFSLIEGKRYAASLKADTVAECIKCIHEGGYATSKTYQSTILKFYAEIKTLIDNIWDGVYNKNEEDVKVYYPTIRMGTCAGKSQVVKTLQTMLNLFGYHLAVDGSWGPLTNAAVLDFQRTHKDVNGVQLAVDGCVGPLTWGALQKGV